jgi:hypothetical protein
MIMNPVGIQELQNRPRYDLDGRRYGNTLSDDMFSIKNPQRANQHTPESYNYLNTDYVEEKPVTLEPVLNTQNQVPLPVLNKPEDFSSLLGNIMPRDFRDNGVSRKKNVTGNGLPWQRNSIYGDDWSLQDDALEFPEYYDQAVVDWAEAQRAENEAKQRVNDLSTEGMREDLAYQRTGAERDPAFAVRREAEWDPYLGTDVNYGAMSPQTMIQLAKMGVNRPDTEDDYTRQFGENANGTYQSLLDAYKLALENGWIK